ncbi:hypothetical protein VP01_1014g3 [Puccinia sorghi]|uniref:Uncharacterized protein n=1 Tax=Puccinia sorghi TaxID=27349 RepID=A0A0L6VVD0_9BASI|nr:hypothetical protein VP01_1014g3 [Puccinia sorghi]
MLFTSLTLAILLALYIPSQTTAHDIDPPSNKNATIDSFSFERQLSWSNRDFDLKRDADGSSVISITAELSDSFLNRFKLELSPLNGRKLAVNVNNQAVFCGFAQTYKIMDGPSNPYQFNIKPRGPLVDRWHIKKFGNLKHSYTWERHFHSLSGVVKQDDNGRKVAYFSAKLGILHFRTPHIGKFTIQTNGDVPLEVLLAVYASAVVRKDKCNW